MSSGNSPVSADKSEPDWRSGQHGLALATVNAQRANAPEPDSIYIIRIEKNAWRFEPYYYLADASGQRLSSVEWQGQTGAAFVINAGQYDTSFRHLGWFVRDTRNFGTRKHPLWKGVLHGSHRSDIGGKDLSIVDLQTTPLSLDSLKNFNAVQSLMLFDASDSIRVNRTGKEARRCAIAEDAAKYMYIIITENDWTLWDLAVFLKSSSLKLKHAMSMDGGSQAQLTLKLADMELTVPKFQMALPCVIGFFPVTVPE